ncbi:unnamed protein product [Boreogadus saida]
MKDPQRWSLVVLPDHQAHQVRRATAECPASEDPKETSPPLCVLPLSSSCCGPALLIQAVLHGPAFFTRF